MNKWCAEHTKNKITSIVNDIANIEAILISAIHFKANWKHQFNKKSTVQKKFNGIKSQTDVQMMSMKQKF